MLPEFFVLWHLERKMSMMGQAIEAPCRPQLGTLVWLTGWEESWFSDSTEGFGLGWEGHFCTQESERVGWAIDLEQEILKCILWGLLDFYNPQGLRGLGLPAISSFWNPPFPWKVNFFFRKSHQFSIISKLSFFYNVNTLGLVEKVMSIFYLCVN